MRSRWALIRAGAKLRLAVRRYSALAAERPGESASERQLRLLRFLGDRSFADFIGVLPGDVADIFRSTLARSSGEPEDLAAGYGIGYFHLVWNRDGGLSRNIVGGPSIFIDELARGLGTRVRTQASVTAVVGNGETVIVRYHSRVRTMNSRLDRCGCCTCLCGPRDHH